MARNGRFGPYVTEVVEEEREGCAEAAHRQPVQEHAAADASRSTTRCGCSRCRGWSASTRATGEEITAQNGRYGPYLKKGTDSRSLTSEDQIFDIDLDEALAIYAQPKQRGRAAASAPLRELGADPVSGTPVVVKDGRFGPYVTDGTTNATLRKDDAVESITPPAGRRAARREARPDAGQADRAQDDREEGGGPGEEDRRGQGHEDGGAQDLRLNARAAAAVMML